MTLSSQRIIEEVDASVHELSEEFKRNWTLFYREHDLASRLYELIQGRLGHLTVADKSAQQHYVVHHEWPTPFKCDMRNGAFEIMDDASSYHRGHYDLVVLNPEFIQEHSFDEVRSFSFDRMRTVLSPSFAGPVAVLYGVELMFRRDRRNGVDPAWFAGLEQDYRKLKASLTRQNLMTRAVTLAFDSFPNSERVDEFVQRFENEPNIRYIPAVCDI